MLHMHISIWLKIIISGCDVLQYLVPKLGKQDIRATTRDGATVIHTAAGTRARVCVCVCVVCSFVERTSVRRHTLCFAALYMLV